MERLFSKTGFFPLEPGFLWRSGHLRMERAQSYYRDALWKENKISIWVTPPQPSFALNPERQSWSKWHWIDAVNDWNWKGNEGKIIKVNIYSSCGEVELFLNGKSLGKKITGRSTKYLAEWQVPMRPEH